MNPVPPVIRIAIRPQYQALGAATWETGNTSPMVHLIAFELNGARLPAERTLLETALKMLGPAYAFHPTAWVVESELSNREICRRLMPLMRRHDRLIVTRIDRDWVAANVPDAESDWLSRCNFASASDREPAVPRVPTVRS
jgi:hypothetical protein